MKITSFRIKRRINSGNRMIGTASVTLDGMIAIADIKILKKDDVAFLAMPSRPLKQGSFKSIVYPINSEVRESLERIIFAAYEFCVIENYAGVQFDVKENFRDSLLEQTLYDFNLVYEVENTIPEIEEDDDGQPLDSGKEGGFLTDWIDS